MLTLLPLLLQLCIQKNLKPPFINESNWLEPIISLYSTWFLIQPPRLLSNFLVPPFIR